MAEEAGIFPDQNGVIQISSDSKLLERLYGNHGVRVRVIPRKPQRKSQTVRQLIDELSRKHERLLEQEERERKGRQFLSSSSSPSVPYSTSDLLYNGETGRSSIGDDLSPKDLVYYDKEKPGRLKDADLRRPSSRNNSRRSISLEKVSINGDKEDLQPLKTSNTTAKQNHFRPTGIRQSYLRGEQLYSSGPPTKSTTSSQGVEKDDLVAMGTLWNPNSVAKNSVLSYRGQYSVSSGSNSGGVSTRRGPPNSRFNMGAGASRLKEGVFGSLYHQTNSIYLAAFYPWYQLPVTIKKK